MAPFILLINAIAALLELVLDFFFDGVTIGRLGRKEKKENAQPVTLRSVAISWGVILISVLVVFIWPAISKRELTILTDDGRPVMMALVEYEKGGEAEQLRTDASGEVTIPRFGVEVFRMKDSRYFEQTWKPDNLEEELIVQRTVLGSGLDRVKDFLLKPANKE